jgi:hypothetical protein
MEQIFAMSLVGIIVTAAALDALVIWKGKNRK